MKQEFAPGLVKFEYFLPLLVFFPVKRESFLFFFFFSSISSSSGFVIINTDYQ